MKKYTINQDENGYYNFINEAGFFLSRDKFLNVCNFYKNYARVQFQDKTWHIIDENGVVFECENINNFGINKDKLLIYSVNLDLCLMDFFYGTINELEKIYLSQFGNYKEEKIISDIITIDILKSKRDKFLNKGIKK